MIADINKVLAEQTLARYFNLIVFIVNQYGEERCETRKMNKKKFLLSLKDSNFKVKLVATYPTEMINDIFYINKNGKTVWIREEIG